MNKFYIILIIVSISYFSGCGGGASEAETELTTVSQEETALVQNNELGIVAGLNLNENISEEDSITVNGEIEWIDGLEGKALLLDSDGEFLSIPDSNDLDLLGNGSISVWVYPTERTSFAGILHKGTEIDFSDEAWSLQYWTEYKPSMILYNESGIKKQITAADTLELNKWHHIAASWGFDPADGKSWFRFFINGDKQGELDVTSFLPLRNSAGDLIIGSQLPEPHSTTYGYLTFRGALDNIIILDHPLTEFVAGEIYNEFSGF